MVMVTIADVEAEMAKTALRGASIYFGPSTSPLRHGQWFASTTEGGVTRQVRGVTLQDALNALLGFQDEVDVITEAPKPQPKVAPAAVQKTNLTDLLL